MSSFDFFRAIEQFTASAFGCGAIFIIKHWLDHERDKALKNHEGEIAQQLENIKHSSAEQLALLQDILSSAREFRMEGLKGKLKLYQDIIGPIVGLVNEMETLADENNPGSLFQLMEPFYPLRLNALCQIALFAPTQIFIAFEELFNLLFCMIDGSRPYSLEEIESVGTKILNLLRKDIGIAEGEIAFSEIQ